MSNYFYNNIGISSLAILYTLKNYKKGLELSKLFLIIPFVSNNTLVTYLSRKNIEILSLDSLIIEKNHLFVNFNSLYKENITLTLNTLQFLNDIKIIKFKNNKVFLDKEMTYHKDMGKRCEKIYEASKNLAKLLEEKNEKIYLNLRIIL